MTAIQHDTPSNPPRRRKAKGPRSKTGCLTCRIRRVKCDEQKPDCHKCSSTGRTCDWDSPVASSQDSSQSSPEPSLPLINFRKSSPVSLVPLISTDYQERRGFAFFHSETAPQLSGCFGSKFWDRFILQSTHQNPTLWHAAVAVGSIHERSSIGDQSVFAANLDREQGGFALREYSKAITSLMNSDGRRNKHSADVVLAACILFACFEIIRGHHGAALSHALSGVKIIKELQGEENGPHESGSALVIPKLPLVPIETLTAMFTRLDTQLCELQPTRAVNILKAIDSVEPGFGPEIPKKFSSITEARNCYDYLYNYVMHTERFTKLNQEHIEPSEESSQYVIECLNKFALYRIALDAFLYDPNTILDAKSQQAANILKLQVICTSQAFSLTNVDGEMQWDGFYAEYSGMVNLAEVILQQPGVTKYTPTYDIHGRPNVAWPPNRPFSMDAGVIVPLFHIVWKCRNSRLRRRGISLLRTYPRQEGIWDGVLVAMCLERVVSIEEQFFGEISEPSDLPGWARVLEVNVVFDMEQKKAYMTYRKVKGQFDSEMITIHETLEW